VLDHLGPLLQGVALAGILAAVMSTLDAQMLTLSSMLTRDVLPPSIGERHPVRLARAFLLVLAAVTFWIVIRQPASIFALASASFSGYVTVVPTLFLGLHWRRFTVWGATTSLLLGNLVLLLGFAGVIPLLGLLPVAWGLGAAIIGAVVGSLASEPTAPEVLERFHGSA
jgi:SSS family solute:Na+ symporter